MRLKDLYGCSSIPAVGDIVVLDLKFLPKKFEIFMDEIFLFDDADLPNQEQVISVVDSEKFGYMYNDVMWVEFKGSMHCIPAFVLRLVRRAETEKNQ